MFKLGYQAFIMFSIVSAYTIAKGEPAGLRDHLDVVFGADIIAGFPTESESDFQQTLARHEGTVSGPAQFFKLGIPSKPGTGCESTAVPAR